MTTITPALIQTAASQLSDFWAVVASHATSVPADEAAAVDIINDAAMLAGPPWDALAPTLAPLLVEGVVLIIANNTQGRPGSQTPMPNSGARGSSGVGGGRIPEEQAGLEDGA